MRAARACVAFAGLGALFCACASSTVVAPRGACGTSKPAAHLYRHVVWIWFENQNFDTIIGGSGSAAAKRAPFFNALAHGCGLATNYHNITHPSLPNYIAATVGSEAGIRDDCLPSECTTAASSIFERLTDEGKSWRLYAEAMPKACAATDSGSYVVRHNPAAYLQRIAADCRRFDVPLGSTGHGALASALAKASLPSFALIVPDVCNDMHDCSVRRGDDWLKRWIGKIVSSHAYQRSDVVLFVTFDEGQAGARKDCIAHAKDSDCHVALIVVSRSTPPGIRSGAFFTHYSLLRTTEELLQVGRTLPLDHPSQSMRRAFGLD